MKKGFLAIILFLILVCSIGYSLAEKTEIAYACDECDVQDICDVVVIGRTSYGNYEGEVYEVRCSNCGTCLFSSFRIQPSFRPYYSDFEGHFVAERPANGYVITQWSHTIYRNGIIVKSDDHCADMSDPSRCVICSGTGIKTHDLFDEEWHYYSFDGSAEDSYNVNRHSATCDDQNHCSICRQSDVIISSITHYRGNTYYYNQDEHWCVCSKCGEVCEKTNHYADCTDSTTCSVCKAMNVSMLYVNHNFNNEDMQWDNNMHWYECLDCGGKIEQSYHYADCLNPNVCLACGADNISISRVDHKYTWNDYTSDSDYHWNQCTKCGSIVNNKMRHHVTHDNPNKCMVCGQENVTSYDIVHQLGNYESNPLIHWLGCEVCGYVDHNDAEKHCVDCRNPSVCMLCGREDIVDPWVEHEFDYNDDYVIREDGHYQVCKNCGQEVLMNTHWASCRYPNKCAICGASDVKIQYVNHGQQILKKDSLSHWYCCADCNEIMYGKSAHSMSCIAPDVCCVCGEEGLTTGQIGHRYEHNEYTYDSEKHWRECADCHEKRYGGHEASCDDPDKCVLCGAISVNISSVKHYGNVLIELTEEGHVYQCANCGRISTTPHYMGDCLRGRCNECGMQIDDMNNVEVDHIALLTGELEQNGHWMQCSQCGYRYLEAHTASCRAPQFCMTCGASGTDYDYEVEHGSFKQEGNQIVCEICGLEHVHIFECWEDGVCSGCGVMLSNVEGADVTHHFDPSFIRDSQGHYQVCRSCDTTTEIESHTISQGVCMVCGYESRLPEDLFTWTESQGKATITGFYGKTGSMIIPSTLNGLPVTAIGSQVFMDNTKLKSVVIPATVTSIGTYAFRGCTALQSISLPDQLTTISNYAFYGTSSLKEIFLSQSVSSIANAAFTESGLEAVTCYTASFAHQWAASKNYRLTLIPVYTDVESMILPKGLLMIDEEAFSGIAAKRIVVPDGCTAIGRKAFSFCADLEVLELPASVKSIDDSMMLGSEGVMILAPKGSYAVEWAEKNHIQVIGK